MLTRNYCSASKVGHLECAWFLVRILSEPTTIIWRPGINLFSPNSFGYTTNLKLPPIAVWAIIYCNFNYVNHPLFPQLGFEALSPSLAIRPIKDSKQRIWAQRSSILLKYLSHFISVRSSPSRKLRNRHFPPRSRHGHNYFYCDYINISRASWCLLESLKTYLRKHFGSICPPHGWDSNWSFASLILHNQEYKWTCYLNGVFRLKKDSVLVFVDCVPCSG